MFYGLSTNKCRRLAFEFAIQNYITILDKWEKKRIAGIDWFLSFKFKYGYLCKSLKQHLSHVQQRSIATLLANFLINQAICMIATNLKCTIFTTVTSTNFSFLNFGKFFKFYSDVKKFFEIL